MATLSQTRPEVKTFFDSATSTFTHVVADPQTQACAVIDPVLDFDPKSGRTSTRSADSVVEHVRSEGLNAQWILETHIHADHLSAAPYVKEHLGGATGIGAQVCEVQETFAKLFNFEDSFKADGSQFDRLFDDGESFSIGSLEVRVIATPGHTPACVSYLAGDALFVGDTIFMPDFGTARCDFPGGDARSLYRSIRKLFALPEDTRMFMCHDYKPGGRELRWETSVAEQRAENKHVRDGISEDEFVSMRTERDSELDMPVLILPAVQVNIRAGALPPPEDNGMRYLKLPVDAL